MNAMRSFVVVALCLSAAGLFGETYNVSDVASLMEALGKASDGDVIECAAGDYPLATQVELSAGVTVRGAGIGKTIFRRDPTVSYSRIAYLHHADAVLEHVTGTGGRLNSSSGAGVLIEAGTIQDCELTDCGMGHWDNNSGSCAMVAGPSSRMLRCSLHDNSSTSFYGQGIALYLQDRAVADSCVIYGNVCLSEYAHSIVYVKGSTLRNCTVVDNWMQEEAAVATVYDANINLIDCVICNNTGARKPSSGGFDLNPLNSSTSARCSNLVLENPGFMNDPAHDYRLSPASPYVDTGSDGTGSQTAVDCGGVTPRLSGDAVDPGAYEAPVCTGPAGHYICNERVKLPGEDFSFGLYSVNAGDDPAFRIDWGDGSDPETVHGTTAKHAYAATGRYTVRLSLDGAADFAIPDYITVCPLNIYVSRSGTATPPYDTEEKATPSIEDAVAAAACGSVVWVAEDEYAFSRAERLCIREGIRIVGQTDDPSKVVFSPYPNAKHAMFLLGNAMAGLYNLTVQGGNVGKEVKEPGSGDCVFIEASGGTVSNCVLRNVSDGTWGNIAGGVAMKGGLVTHCVLSNLVTSLMTENRNGMAAHVAGGSMENCLVTKCVGTGSESIKGGGVVALSGTGRLVNCTIAGNQMNGPAGIRLLSTTAKVINCVIADNKTLKVPGDTVNTYVGYNSNGTAIDVTGCFVNCAAEIDINGTCKSGDLAFLNAAEHDYHLTVGSKTARDNGVVPADYQPPATDLDGASRMDDGKIDIGCYELHVTGVAASFSADALKGAAPCTVRFEATVEGADPQEVTYLWDVYGDGSEIVTTDKPELEYEYSVYGEFAVKLTVVKGGSSYPAVNTVPFWTYPKNLYVNATNETPESPYDTPSKAARGFPDVLALASDDSVVHVLPGTYPVQTLELAVGLSVVGETGQAEDVIIQPVDNKQYHGFLLNNGAAKVFNLTVENFTYGNEYNPGAGFYIDGKGGTVSNCIMRSCTASGWGGKCGGGVYMCGPGLVTHCVISNCSANAQSGNGSDGFSGSCAISMTDGTIRNCLFADNAVSSLSTGDGVGGIASVIGGVLENCTLARNASRYCAGIYCGAKGLVRNCVVGSGRMLTSDKPATNAGWAGTASGFSRCTFDVERPNDDCKTVAAPFVSSATGDFTLAAGCGAIDFASEQDWMAGATDLAGNPRISGDAPDAGCYEKKAGVFSASFAAVTPTEGFAPLTIDFEVSWENDGGEGVTCLWYEGLETEPFATTTDAAFSFKRPDTGWTSLRLAVKDNVTGAIFEVPGSVPIYAAPRTIYVVPEEAAGEGVAPYGSWATAARDLTSALSVALDGATIVVSNGFYRTDAQIVVDKAVTVAGFGQTPEDTNIHYYGGGSRVFYLNHAQAVLTGLAIDATYANGMANVSSGGLVWAHDGGTITNCVLRNGKANGWEGYGGAVYLENGVLSHCVISNCTTGSCGGPGSPYYSKGSAVFMSGGRMENCLVVANCQDDNENTKTDNNGGAIYLSGGSVVNCTIVSNRFPSCAGVFASGGTVANSLIVGNKSTLLSGDVAQWRGNADCFRKCLSDTAQKINDSCLTGSTEVFRQARIKRSVFIPLGKSAARDAGDNAFVSEATDLYGNPRVFSKDVDLGCAESQAGGMTLLVK